MEEVSKKAKECKGRIELLDKQNAAYSATQSKTGFSQARAHLSLLFSIIQPCGHPSYPEMRGRADRKEGAIMLLLTHTLPSFPSCTHPPFP